MADVERLVLRMEANMRGYERALQKMQRDTDGTARRVENRFRQKQRNVDRTFQNIQRNAVRALGAIGIAVSAAGLARLVSDSLQAAESLNDLSKQVNANVEGLQTLRFAVDQNGGSADVLDRGLRRLAEGMGRVLAGQTNEATRALDRLGLAQRIQQGEIQTTDQLFRELARALQSVETQQERAALASQIFGQRLGVQLAQSLSLGSEGLRQFEDRAREAGHVMGEDLVANGAEVNAMMREMRQRFSRRMQTAVVENADAIRDFAEALEDVAEFGVRAASSIGQFYRAVIQGQALAGAPAAQAMDIQGIMAQMQRGELGRGAAGQVQLGLRMEAALGRDLANQILASVIDGPIDYARVVVAGYTDRQIAQITRELDQARRGLLDFGEIRRDLSFVPGIGWVDQDMRPVTPSASPAAEAETDEDDADDYGEAAGEAFIRTIENMGPPEWVLQGMEAIRHGQTLYDEAMEDQRQEEEDRERARRYTQAQLDEYNRARNRFADEFASTFASGMMAAWDGRLQDFIKAQLRNAMFNALSEAFAAIGRRVFDRIAGGIIPFGGKRASGGGVSPGRAYTVGERGPETFVPGMRGSILPNPNSLPGRTGGGGGTIRIMLHVGEGPEFATRVQQISAPLVLDGVQVAVQTARAEVAGDFASGQSRRLR